jgi:K(+)-stimulated pyrophosphate-energized sodium pump
MVLTSVALIPVVLGVLGLIAAFGIYRIVLKYPEGTGKVAAIAELIHRGALVFIRREYSFLGIFVVVVAALIFFSDLGWRTAVAFLVGAGCSAARVTSVCLLPLELTFVRLLRLKKVVLKLR